MTLKWNPSLLNWVPKCCLQLPTRVTLIVLLSKTLPKSLFTRWINKVSIKIMEVVQLMEASMQPHPQTVIRCPSSQAILSAMAPPSLWLKCLMAHPQHWVQEQLILWMIKMEALIQGLWLMMEVAMLLRYMQNERLTLTMATAVPQRNLHAFHATVFCIMIYKQGVFLFQSKALLVSGNTLVWYMVIGITEIASASLWTSSLSLPKHLQILAGFVLQQDHL